MEELSVPVEEFTTPNPITATEDTTVEQMNELMNKYRIRHIPILRDGRVVGIVSDRNGGDLGQAIISINVVAPVIAIILVYVLTRIQRDEDSVIPRARAAGEPV